MLNKVSLKIKKDKEKSQTYDLNFCIGQTYFSNDG